MNSVLRNLLMSLLPLLLLAGCSGKKEDDKKSDGSDSTVRDKKDGPAKPKPPEKENDKDKEDKPPPEQPSGQRVTSEKLGAEFRDDVKATTAKYNGKVLELSGVVEEIGLSPTGDAFLVLAGTQVPTPQQFECLTIDKDPWNQVTPGQTVTLRGRCEVLGGELKFRNCQITGKTGPERTAIKSADLAQAYEKDAEAAAKTYEDKWLEVSGEVEKVERLVSMEKAVLTLKTTGKVPISCVVDGGMVKQAEKLKPGQMVKVLGRVKVFDAGAGVELLSCVLVAKP